MAGRKEIYIHNGNEQKLKEIEKNEKSFSAWVNELIKKYIIRKG